MLKALYTACVIIPIGFAVFMMVYLLCQKKAQVILCTECQQCKAACPLLSKGCNPMSIMLAAKSGGNQEVMEQCANLCVGCGKCQEACPRGLAPFLELEKWRTVPNQVHTEGKEWTVTQEKKAA